VNITNTSYVISIMNDGTAEDNYTITTNETNGITSTLNKTAIIGLDVDKREDILITVNATENGNYTTNVTITSSGNNSLSKTTTYNTEFIFEEDIIDFNVSIASNQTVYNTTNMTFVVTVTNNGTLDDNYTISINQSEGANATINTTEINNLTQGSSEDLLVQVFSATTGNYTTDVMISSAREPNMTHVIRLESEFIIQQEEGTEGSEGTSGSRARGRTESIHIPRATTRAKIPSLPQRQNSGVTTEAESAGEGSVETNAKKVLFDIGMDMVTEEVTPEGELIVALTLINVGEEGTVRVNVTYTIEDMAGSVVLNEKEELEVETQLEYLKAIDVSGLETGSYRIRSELAYEGQTEPAVSAGEFEIKEERRGTVVEVRGVGYLIIVLFIIVSAWTWYFIHQKHGRFIKNETQVVENDEEDEKEDEKEDKEERDEKIEM